MAVEPKRASVARNQVAVFSIVAGLVVATCAGMYFRAEVSYVAQHTVGGDLLASETAPAKPATLLKPATATAEHSINLPAERDLGANLVSELAMTRRDVETKAALLSKAADEAAQLRQTTEATPAELRQSLVQERDRVAALARELATARRDLETEVALSRKAGEEAEQLKQAAKVTTAELEQERNRSAALARDPEPAQRVTEARSTTERPAGSPIIDHEIAEQLRRSYRGTR